MIPKVTSNNILIPKESIRFRVIANSNSKEDQDLKLKVKESLNQDLNSILSSSKTINESRENISNNMESIDNDVKTTLLANNSNQSYKINYGQNYFPQKEYKGVIYPEGNYESLVVTLGDGMGENWWCVLFPPLCLLEADENDTQNVEYQFFVKKIIDKFSK